MEYKFRYIVERDADFAIINSFIQEENVRELFLNQINVLFKRLIKVYQSHVSRQKDNTIGESDIIFIIEDIEGIRHAIFVEDKIKAQPQPNQKERYDERADIMKEDTHEFDCHHIFLCAPQDYINSDDSDYKYSVSYEKIINASSNSLYKEILQFSLDHKNQIVVDDEVSDFWQNLLDLMNKFYPQLFKLMQGKSTKKGSRAVWVTFNIPNVKNVSVIYKSNNGYIDIEFANMADNQEDVETIAIRLGIDLKEFVPTKTGKSLSLRYKDERYCVNFHEPFENNQHTIIDILNTIYKVCFNYHWDTINDQLNLLLNK